MSNGVPCESGRYWRVRRGDSLYRIALFTATNVNQLLALNPQIDPLNIPVGSLICLPPEPVCASGLFWRVSPGDTLYTIAAATQTTVERLLELNPNIEPLNLQVGQELCLPG